MASELAYEYFALALESTKGTAIANPTDFINLEGMLTHKKAKRRAADNVGVLSDVIRSQTVKKWAEWEASGDLDVNKVPLYAALGINGTVSAVITQGVVDYIDVTAAGTGYTSTPTVTFTGGAGSGAAATAILSGTTVVGVVVTAPGSGYTTAPTIGFTGGGGASAAATAVIYKAGTLSKLWRWTRTMTSDDLKAATMFWGDPNVQIFRGAYGMLDEINLKGDAGGEDPVTIGIKGMSRYPTAQSPTAPARSYGSMIMPLATQVWIDGSEGYGVTPVTGRVISFEHTIPSGVTYKYVAAGPSGGLTFDHTARKRTHAVTKLVMELADLTQFNQYDADTLVRFRIRHNGSLIETVSSVDHYNSITLEGMAPFDALSWGSYQESNRTIELTLEHEYDSVMGTDLVLWSENTRATL